jgi:acetyltransferase-like isoleucine patch superfamily enzyme
VNGDVSWMVHFTFRVTGPSKMAIGRGVWQSLATSGGCYIQAINGISIDDGSIFGPNVCIISANHDPRDHAKHLAAEPIRIGRDCWIGANAVILPGVALGDGVVVGAGAVVTRSFPSRVVIGGVPAELLHRLPDDDDRGSGLATSADDLSSEADA